MQINKPTIGLISFVVGLVVAYFAFGNVRSKGVGTWDGITNRSANTDLLMKTSHHSRELVLHVRYNFNQGEIKTVRAWLDDLEGQKQQPTNLVDLLRSLNVADVPLRSLKYDDFAKGLPSGWQLHCSIDRSKGNSKRDHYIDLVFRQPLPQTLANGSVVKFDDVDNFLDKPANYPGVRAALLTLLTDESAKNIITAWPI